MARVFDLRTHIPAILGSGSAVRRPIVWITLGALWFGAVVVGLGSLMNYDNRSGIPAEAPAEWPADSGIVRDLTRPTLIMLAHPQCDCTRASLGEFAELIARARNRPQAIVVFIKPGGVPREWEKTSLWREAARIPTVTVVSDDDGREARRFGVQTSGQTLLYAADGHLLFSGGATGARGKAGDNAGRATLLALLNGESSDRPTSPVFGCSLFAPPEHPTQDAHAHGL